MIELWRPVVGFEGYYEVSSIGNVRSIDRSVTRTYADGSSTTVNRRGQIMKPDYRDGYATVRLQANKRTFKPYIHRMVCEAFNGASDHIDKDVVAHNDGDPRNNSYKNLRWATKAENQRDRESHGTHNRGDKSHLAKLNWDVVGEIRSSKLSAADLSRKYSVTSANIRHILRMKTWVPIK